MALAVAKNMMLLLTDPSMLFRSQVKTEQSDSKSHLRKNIISFFWDLENNRRAKIDWTIQSDSGP